MYEKNIKEMIEMSRKVGSMPDYTQGGGGNTSVKLDDELMAVKASGCRLCDITATDGYVVVDYKSVRHYFDTVDLSEKRDFYKESSQFVKDNMVKLEGLNDGRPSIEAGFHSLLEKYVIHTHSVYSNLLCCSRQGESIAKQLFEKSPYRYLWLPYIAPGFYLTLEIQKKIKTMGCIPSVIFMGSHGVIITGKTMAEAEKINEYVSDRIKERLNITKPYGNVAVKQLSEGVYQSDTPRLISYLKGKDYTDEWFDSNILYPDQAAYLLGAITTRGEEKKARINLKTGITRYHVSYKEALTLEESICAFLFIMDQACKNNLDIYTMEDEDIAFIMGWEGEAYRKAMLNKK